MKYLKLPLTIVFVSLLCACQTGSDGTVLQQEETNEPVPTGKSGEAFIEDDASTPNVLRIAIESPEHTTLVAAVQAAGLENALVNAGPLTVFAPTNAAFDALPAGTVENLLKEENKDVLATILKHHVSAGNYDKEFLKKFKKLSQASDLNTTIEVKGEDVYVGGAKIVASVKAGNGIVHVVDAVILPPSN